MRPNKITSIIIEGIDRVGKDTLVSGLLNEYGYHQVVHFEKPLSLRVYDSELNPPLALFRYQQESFINMFKMIDSGARFIFNRAHIGEMVYSNYRKYRGEYVLDLEQDAIARGKLFPQNTLLVLLYAPDISMLKDDGKSFDATKKKEEQTAFREAYNLSSIPSKVMVPVTIQMESLNPSGPGRSVGFREPNDILEDVARTIYKIEAN
jgi:hypothetical protein